jgi:hypothetical protein
VKQLSSSCLFFSYFLSMVDLNSRCDIQSPENPAYFFGGLHSKFAASFGSPLPLYFAA